MEYAEIVYTWSRRFSIKNYIAYLSLDYKMIKLELRLVILPILTCGCLHRFSLSADIWFLSHKVISFPSVRTDTHSQADPLIYISVAFFGNYKVYCHVASASLNCFLHEFHLNSKHNCYWSLPPGIHPILRFLPFSVQLVHGIFVVFLWGWQKMKKRKKK